MFFFCNLSIQTNNCDVQTYKNNLEEYYNGSWWKEVLWRIFQSNKERFKNSQFAADYIYSTTYLQRHTPFRAQAYEFKFVGFQLKKEISNRKGSALSWLRTIPFAHLQNVQGSWMQYICQNKWPKKFSCMNGRGKRTLHKWLLENLALFLFW